MSEERNEPEAEEPEESEVRPPSPDAPMDSDSEEPAPPPPTQPEPAPPPASPDAQMKMAEEIESGGTPYDYSAAIEEEDKPEDEPPGRQGFSISDAAVIMAIAALVAVSFVGYGMFGAITGKVDEVNTSIEKLAENLSTQKQVNVKTGEAVVRAELRKSLKIVESIIELNDPETRPRAEGLRDEIMDILAALGSQADETRIEPGTGL